MLGVTTPFLRNEYRKDTSHIQSRLLLLFVRFSAARLGATLVSLLDHNEVNAILKEQFTQKCLFTCFSPASNAQLNFVDSKQNSASLLLENSGFKPPIDFNIYAGIAGMLCEAVPSTFRAGVWSEEVIRGETGGQTGIPARKISRKVVFLFVRFFVFCFILFLYTNIYSPLLVAC